MARIGISNPRTERRECGALRSASFGPKGHFRVRMIGEQSRLCKPALWRYRRYYHLSVDSQQGAPERFDDCRWRVCEPDVGRMPFLLGLVARRPFEVIAIFLDVPDAWKWEVRREDQLVILGEHTKCLGPVRFRFRLVAIEGHGPVRLGERND